MSGYALSKANSSSFRHSLQDDMESLVLVLLYCSVFWLQHTINHDARETIADFFEGKKGYEKYEAAMTKGEIDLTLDTFGFDSGKIVALRTWFISVYKDMRKFYRAREKKVNKYGPGVELCLPPEKMWELAQLKKKHDIKDED